MSLHKSLLIKGFGGRSMAADLYLPEGTGPFPSVLYVHGFVGFKDWGSLGLIARRFANAGMAFISYNGSHNGTTPQAPTDFTDLEAFGQNTYSIELHDLRCMLEHLRSEDYVKWIDPKRIALLGHSRGGALSILAAAQDADLAALVTWAAVDHAQTPWRNWPVEKMEAWRQSGVAFYHNGRTGQDLPLQYVLYEDYLANQQDRDVPAAMSRLRIPILLVHGTEDISVPVDAAYRLHASALGARLLLVKSDHVFGRRHPWPEADLPEAAATVVEKTIEFLRERF